MLKHLAIFLSLLTGTAAAHAQSIPPIHAESLAGNTVILPADLHGHPAILVLGLSRGSQDQVAAWGKRLAAEYNDSATVQFYELAMLASVPRPIRGFVIRSMKKSVPGRAQSRFLPLVTDEDAWRALAHYSGGDDASILLIDGRGALLWQTHGPPTDSALQELHRHLP